MRDLINLLTETGLSAKQLGNYGGKHLVTLIDLASKNQPIEVVPDQQSKYGKTVTLTPNALQELQAAYEAGKTTGVFNLPRSIVVNSPKLTPEYGNVYIALSNLFKDARFKATASGEGKAYNAGHLNELMMGLAVSAKFLNLGNPITLQQVIAMGSKVAYGVEGKNMLFSMNLNVTYPDKKSKQDTMNFRGVVPMASAQAFVNHIQSGQIPNDILALFNGAVKYANTGERVIKACTIVRNDPNSNQIDVVSDGTSDAKGTKADLKIGVDGTDVALLSLKTRSSDTLGQISGVTFENMSLWFSKCFNVNIDPYKQFFDPQLDKNQIYQNVYKLYDDIVIPQMTLAIEKQSPATEAEIVRRIANAALFFARGDKLEDVEVVKLDDKIAEGNYKILRFTDGLYDAMKMLDLDLVHSSRDKGRTVKIMIKPDPAAEVVRKSNLLCQFRTQMMGDYLRHYFESGSVLEELTHVKPPVDVEDERAVSKLRPRRGEDAPREKRK